MKEGAPISFTNVDRLASFCERAYKSAIIGKYVVSGLMLLSLIAILLHSSK